MKVLILCTGNSSRSQMAQALLQSLDKNVDVHSAGTVPASKISQKAVMVMAEIGIDISSTRPKSVNQYLNDEWDYVITVCDEANETCPVFFGKVKHRLHMRFEDPSKASGTDAFVLSKFRRIRDEIKDKFYDFFVNNLKIN